jgi:hypothetical protein
MATTGTVELDFGAFPGASDASVAVTGQAAIIAGSLVEAWFRPVDTADHSADEHMLETIKVFAHSIVPGTGFTISGFNTSQLNEPLSDPDTDKRAALGTSPRTGAAPGIGGMGTRIYGKWTVAWVWN